MIEDAPGFSRGQFGFHFIDLEPRANYAHKGLILNQSMKDITAEVEIGAKQETGPVAAARLKLRIADREVYFAANSWSMPCGTDDAYCDGTNFLRDELKRLGYGPSPSDPWGEIDP